MYIVHVFAFNLASCVYSLAILAHLILEHTIRVHIAPCTHLTFYNCTNSLSPASPGASEHDGIITRLHHDVTAGGVAPRRSIPTLSFFGFCPGAGRIF